MIRHVPGCVKLIHAPLLSSRTNNPSPYVNREEIAFLALNVCHFY
jgi:hypothetical protein